jgi:DNA-binding CsgD family transcriptional regulator
VKLTTDASSQFLDVALQRYQVSNREREIMELILQGKSNKEIEDVLFISYNTVKNHIYNLYQKLGVKSRGQLINFVLEARRSIER